MSAPNFTAGPLYPADISYVRNGERMFHLIDAKGRVVCDGYMTEGDATLWAAAPDLYAACKAAEELETRVNRAFYVTGTRKAMVEAMSGQREILASLRAAIAKAEGGTV